MLIRSFRFHPYNFSHHGGNTCFHQVCLIQFVGKDGCIQSAQGTDNTKRGQNTHSERNRGTERMCWGNRWKLGSLFCPDWWEKDHWPPPPVLCFLSCGNQNVSFLATKHLSSEKQLVFGQFSSSFSLVINIQLIFPFVYFKCKEIYRTRN